MPLPSFLKRSRAARSTLGAAQAAALDPGVIEQARIRARRRLVGAAILVIAGVVGFPLLFDSQPRPVPGNVAVQVAHGDGRVSLAAPVQMSAAGEDADGGDAEPAAPTRGARAAARDARDEQQDDKPQAPPDPRPDARPDPKTTPAARPSASPAAARPTERTAGTASQADAAAHRSATASAKPGSAATTGAAPVAARGRDDGARAQALLEGRDPAPANASANATAAGRSAGPTAPAASNEAAPGSLRPPAS